METSICPSRNAIKLYKFGKSSCHGNLSLDKVKQIYTFCLVARQTPVIMSKTF